MDNLELFTQGLIVGFFVAIWILYLSGYFNIDSMDRELYRKSPDGASITVIQNCMITLVLMLCGVSAVLIFG